MAAPLELLPGYEHVVSRRDVSEVDRLLRLVEPGAASTSLVLSGTLEEDGLMGLRGLGREIWQDEEAQDYIDRLRQEWER